MRMPPFLPRLYMPRLLKAGILKADTPPFYEYLNFSGVSLKELLRDVLSAVRKKPGNSSYSEALDELNQAKGWPIVRLIRDFNDIIGDHPILRGTMRDCALRLCQTIAEAEPRDAQSWTLALQKLAGIFGLTPEAQALLEFAYIHETESDVGCYLEHELGIFRMQNRNMFASALNMNISVVMNALHELQTCRLLGDEPINNGFRGIDDAVYQIYETPDADPEELFCTPLKGETLPLESFNIPREDLDYITRLMKSGTHSPVHIMIYGTPGTGKTTFARSIAHELGLTACTANTSLRDSRAGRESSITASMNIASRKAGSFIVIDEAEVLLQHIFPRGGKESTRKALHHNCAEAQRQRILHRFQHKDSCAELRCSCHSD